MKLIYRPEIDGLRAIAVVAVILYHTQITIFGYQPFKGGFIGVDIFFVISGYLITSIILKELFTTGYFSFKYFYERRIRRILPALLFVMLASFAFAWRYLLPSSFIDFSKSILYSLGFISNFYFHNSGQQYGTESGSLKPFLHTWSLSVEEQFYILFPVVLFIIFKYFKKHLITIFGIMFIASLLMADWGSRNHPSFNFYILPTRGWEILAGSILAYFEITLGQRSKNKTLNLILPSIGMFLIGFSMIFFTDTMFHPSFYTLSPITGACLIIWFSHKDELITKILSTKLFVSIGLMSYSLYLWHYPIFAFDRISEFTHGSLVKKLILGIVILTMSFVSYYFIERPARDKNKKFKLIFFYVLFIYFFLVILNSYILNIIPSYYDKNKPITNVQSNFEDFNCKYNDKIKYNYNEAFLVCQLTNNKYKKKIYLIGDSHAFYLSYDLASNLVNDNYQLNIISYGSCMLFRAFDLIEIKTKKKINCRFYDLVEKIFKENNSIFIIAARFPVILENSYFNNMEGGVEFGSIDTTYIPNGKYNSIETSFKSEISKLSLNNKVILVYPIPEVGWNVEQKLLNASKKKLIFKKNYFKEDFITTSYEVYKDRTQSSFKLLDSIQGVNIHRVYPHTLFCNTIIKSRCITHDDKNIFYSDDDHPSIKGAEKINDLILQEIKKIDLEFK